MGGIFLLYGLVAAYDYVMSLSQGAVYYRASGMSQMQVEYFSSIPAWAIIGWTLSVWGGLFAALALFFRRRFSQVLFLLSLVGGLIYITHVLVLSAGREAMGVLWLMPIIITVITAAMVFYCQRLINVNILI
ncbi:MAG TPA: hypothetical protein VIZ65_14020 [Cellvibrionaceae bacterium]